MDTRRRKKLYAVLIAALVGAAFGDAVILLDNLAFHMLGPSNPVSQLDVLSAILSSVVASALSLHRLPNAYLVNAVFGACLGAGSMAFWHFVIKGTRD